MDVLRINSGITAHEIQAIGIIDKRIKLPVIGPVNPATVAQLDIMILFKVIPEGKAGEYIRVISLKRCIRRTAFHLRMFGTQTKLGFNFSKFSACLRISGIHFIPVIENIPEEQIFEPYLTVSVKTFQTLFAFVIAYR